MMRVSIIKMISEAYQSDEYNNIISNILFLKKLLI